jgi:phage terminase large subunit
VGWLRLLDMAVAIPRRGESVGWGSRKAPLVDRLGDLDSIFEKMRRILDTLPKIFMPRYESNYMKIVNLTNGASITGETGDDIGRGGRKLIYFKDESAHYEHPESIEAALSENTRVQVDISSVAGLGNVFHRRREAGIDWYPGQRVDPRRTNVFVLDWRDHPGKNQEWYDQRQQRFIDDGLLHIFRQEVDRDYAAAVENTIIPANWIRAAINAHKKLLLPDEGRCMAGLDVADSGGHRNALAIRRGIILRYIDCWGERDTGATARKTVAAVRKYAPLQVQYDCVGVGAGVKAETNRLRDDGLLPEGIRFIPFDAAAQVRKPDQRVVQGDRDSPLNKDFYANLKAQAWWDLRRRFEKTWRAVIHDEHYEADELISLDGDMPRIRELEKELAQPTITHSARLKLMVEKKPEGTRSPNMADAVVMCFFPVQTYDTSMQWVGSASDG